MDKQPFLRVKLSSGELKLINESQVCSVDPEENNCARIRMSNGDEFVVVEPPYADWENDYFTRK